MEPKKMKGAVLDFAIDEVEEGDGAEEDGRGRRR